MLGRTWGFPRANSLGNRREVSLSTGIVLNFSVLGGGGRAEKWAPLLNLLLVADFMINNIS